MGSAPLYALTPVELWCPPRPSCASSKLDPGGGITRGCRGDCLVRASSISFLPAPRTSDERKTSLAPENHRVTYQSIVAPVLLLGDQWPKFRLAVTLLPLEKTLNTRYTYQYEKR